MFNKFFVAKKDQLTIAYKILHDILFVILIFFSPRSWPKEFCRESSLIISALLE